MHKSETSIRGKVIREMITHTSASYLNGMKIKNGEIRKKFIEPHWRYSKRFELKKIVRSNFTMEFLKRPKSYQDKVLLQLHGGGYIGMLRNVHRNMARLYSDFGAGISVLTPDYRVAPEYPFPAALEDALSAFDWLLENGYTEKQIIIAGDSAGGGLTMALCMYLREQGRKLPCGIITMSPWTDMTSSGESYNFNYEKDPLFGNSRDSLLYNRDYLANENEKNPYISPAFGEFKGFPPMLIQTGSYEMLLSDSIVVAKKAKEAGVKVRFHIYEGMFHNFQMAGLLMPESKRAWIEVGKFLKIISQKKY